MPEFLQIFCSLLSSVLIALAIPNELLAFGSPLIGLFSLFPFYIAINRCKSYSETFWLCFLHGAVTHLLSSFWLGNFAGFSVFTLGASDLGTGFFEGFFSLFYYLPFLYAPAQARLERLSGKNHFAIPVRVLWFASIYTIWEYCKSTGFLAYPWGTISMTAYEWSSVTQIADISGVYGITFLFALFSGLVGEGVLLLTELSNSSGGKKAFESYKTVCTATLALFTLTILYGFYQLFRPITPVKTMNTILVQQNKNPNRKFEEENILLAEKITQEKIDEIKAQGKPVDLTVWSEAVLSKRFPAAESYYTFFPSENPLVKFIRKNKIPFIIGGPVVFNDEAHEYGNSALLFDKNGKYSGAYTKMHLVPFAELIPFRKIEPIRKIIKAMIGFSYGWTPGKKPVLFEVPLNNSTEDGRPFKIISLAENGKGKSIKDSETAIFSTPVCFDDSAHEVCQALFHSGSELFVNITNDSWSKTNSSEIQHFVVAHYRSIEYRTTTIRSANAGYTCIIDAKGQVLADLPLFVEGALFYEVPVYERKMTV
ncbi:MAG: apolipoprotein N-acyltransferase, partial [Treponema sp.]|nr:apolipoprotein N-acyltransferase [Treponema sp.]